MMRLMTFRYPFLLLWNTAAVRVRVISGSSKPCTWREQNNEWCLPALYLHFRPPTHTLIYTHQLSTNGPDNHSQH